MNQIISDTLVASLKSVLVLAFFILFLPHLVYADNQSSISFLGTDEYLSLTDTPQLVVGDTTFEFWIQPDLLARDQFIINRANPAIDQTSYFVFLNSVQKIEGRFSEDGTLDDGKHIRFLSDEAIDTTVWNHVAVTLDVDQSNVQIYVNGAEVGVEVFGSMGPNIFLSEEDLLIGARKNNVTQSYFSGLIDELRIWQEIRTSIEIIDNYRLELNTQEDRLAAYWEFDNSLVDVTSNFELNNNGTSYSSETPFSSTEEKIDRDSFITVVEAAVADEHKRTKRFLLHQANKIFDKYEDEKYRQANTKLRIFKRLVRFAQIQDADLNQLMKDLKQQIKEDRKG